MNTKSKCLPFHFILLHSPGFLIDRSEIRSVCEELWEGMKVVADVAAKQNLGPDPSREEELRQSEELRSLRL